MKLLILEDEIPAYEKIKSYAMGRYPNGEIVGWARTVSEGRKFLSEHMEIDLILSDIELLDGLSIDLFEEVKVSAPIIFCTAFDQYLLRAFQSNGISYMLKPYNEESFHQAIDKFELLYYQKEAKQDLTLDTLTDIKQALSSKDKSYKKRFSIKKSEGILLVHTDDVVMIEANGDFCMIHDQEGRKHVCNQTLGDLESILNPMFFFRINRSEIVRIDYIEKIEQHFKNRLLLKMKKIDREVFTSGSKTPLFRKWIDS